MTRKSHLQHNTVKFGPTCKGGRFGAGLSGEHITVRAAEFLATPAELRCDRCASSKLFAFLQRVEQRKAALA